MATIAAMTSSSVPTPLSSSNSGHRRHRRPMGVAMASLGGKAASLGLEIVEGDGGLPKVCLSSDHGSKTEIYLYGACVTSWQVSSGKDLLFVRPDAVFNGKKPISGGIPHCFPQFGPGPMQQHGFARNMNWSIAASDEIEGDPSVTLELKDDSYSHSMWDFYFKALYKVTLHSKSLSTVLTITNMDKKPFSFSSALHTYFRASAADASVKGLKGCKTLNKDPDPSNPLEGEEEREVITFPGFVDCVYLGAPKELQLDNGLGDILTIQNMNWPDAVLWNPHLQMESCYKDFVCVENAQIGKVHLEPEQSWVAEQLISII
ncbi:hypothetical protein J5N97_019627 [Dioscorea zingiberensis]|uniref:glucose-6-phosphate 1-epimerase n=1 Tax=Dioscorea zingiberensis TaxID=325984 RepID=A0A9D5CEG4_9LILI|nr:hypothetical protein J5N97_019627 [Dioscorea zingiberensis]